MKKLRALKLLHCLSILGLLLTPLSGCKKAETVEPTAVEKPASALVASEAGSPPAADSKSTNSPTVSTEIAPLTEAIQSVISTNGKTSVQEYISKIADSNLTAAQKAEAFLSMLPSFNRDDQRILARATLKYVTEPTHTLIQKPLLEGKLDRQILSIFMTDTLKRPDRIKLPVLRELAGVEGHPLQTEARELLVAFVGKDNGAK